MSIGLFNTLWERDGETMSDTEYSGKKDSTAAKATYANLSEAERQKLTGLENTIQEETGEKVALVAYRI